jgi:hypothetical protein
MRLKCRENEERCSVVAFSPELVPRTERLLHKRFEGTPRAERPSHSAAAAQGDQMAYFYAKMTSFGIYLGIMAYILGKWHVVVTKICLCSNKNGETPKWNIFPKAYVWIGIFSRKFWHIWVQIFWSPCAALDPATTETPKRYYSQTRIMSTRI